MNSRIAPLFLSLSLLLACTACAASADAASGPEGAGQWDVVTAVVLSDGGVTVDGVQAPADPAVIFYRVYECGSVNYVDGSYVAKIYKEGMDKKLHKYDGAFYSKMSMNIGGESRSFSGITDVA